MRSVSAGCLEWSRQTSTRRERIPLSIIPQSAQMHKKFACFCIHTDSKGANMGFEQALFKVRLYENLQS